MICPQCQQPIDPSMPYEAGGRPGFLDQITRPSHLGDCETMPPFVWQPAVRPFIIPVPAAWRMELVEARREAARKAWVTMRARRAA
jgi:hypothetical protein